MFQRITLSCFIDAFRHAGRESQFSREALEALFDYIENLEEEAGVPLRLDVVALCCDYQESDVDEIISDYGLDASGCKTDDDRRALVEDFLNEHTTVIWRDGDTFLFQQF